MSEDEGAKPPRQESLQDTLASLRSAGETEGKSQRDLALRALGLTKPADPSHYERAYRMRLAIYKGGALASYTLLDADERAERLASLDEAYKLLRRDGIPTEASKRAPKDPARSESTSAQAPDLEDSDPPPKEKEDRGPPPPLDIEAPGTSLRRSREHLGLTLEELADRTRISRTHLKALEEELFEALPPAVYIRGFTMQYARALGISQNEAGALADALLGRRPGA